MTLEQQVCSLELSKRLNELGVKQESYFWWNSRMAGDEEESFIMTKIEWETYYQGEYGYVCLSAFTVAELGELMHENWKTFKMKNWKWFYKQTGDKESRMYGPYKTEAEARAICIIKRLEKMEQFRALSTKSLLA